jgi:hypothetical protein
MRKRGFQTRIGDAVRDYDDPAGIAAYKVWKDEHPELAGSLPTARTKNGYHVYFLAKVSGTSLRVIALDTVKGGVVNG